MPAIIPQFNLLEKYVTKEKLKGIQDQRARNKLLDYRSGIRFEREGKTFEQQQKKGKLDMAVLKFKTVEEMRDSIEGKMRFINWEGYAASRDYFIDLGADEFMKGTLLPKPENFVKQAQESGKSVAEVFEKWKTDTLGPALVDIKEQIDKKKLEQMGHPDIGALRKFESGSEKVTEEFKGKGVWGEKARAPRKLEGKDTEFKIRKELAAVEKARKALEKTGGISDILFTLLSESNPEKAAELKGTPEESAAYLKEWEDWLRSQLIGGQTTTQPAEAKGFTHEYRNRKLFKVK
ncbi:MAG: hypothetical protein E3J94_07115 [Desulfobacteraceae bacterium]|nr:MAG: hypothetical protein E3J94_07115 [Desulfobacteraceae bacterium]